MFCPCCMENHELQIRKVEESSYKSCKIPYVAEYYYCPTINTYYASEDQIRSNFESMEDAWREKKTAAELAERVLELDKLYTEVHKVSGLTLETIIELFEEGYTLEAPDNTKPLWNEIDRFAKYD